MEQLDRVRRYLERIRSTYQGISHCQPDVECYEDDVVSFFIHCHHLGDWVTQINKLGLSKESVNSFINSHSELRLCADLCNLSKHCMIQRVRSRSKPHLAYRATEISIFPQSAQRPPTFKSAYKIICGSAVYDALELAEKCYSIWHDYLQSLSATARSTAEA